MIWTSLLLSVSGYTWYLIFLSAHEQIYPHLLAGFAGLFFISILPAALGFILNDFLLNFKPTILKIILINSLLYLLIFGATAWYSGFWGICRFPDGNLAGKVTKLSLLLPTFWQLLSWLCGTYFLISSHLSLDREQTFHSGALWTSLILVIPAAFILTFMDLPLIPLMGIIICWFILMAMSLALEGTVSVQAGFARYDYIIIHTLVPLIIGCVLYFAAFSRDLRELLQGAREMVCYLAGLLLGLLNFLFSGVPEADPKKWDGYRYLFPEEGATEKAVELPLPPWVMLLLLIAAMLLVIFKVLPALMHWLGSRLEAKRTVPKRRPAVTLKSLLLFWRRLAGTAIYLIKGAFKGVKQLIICISINKALLCIYGKVKGMLRRLLPARTPYEKVLRSYENFLRWGRRCGCRRKPAETPWEYAGRLQELSWETGFPREEINRLTGLFLEARYSSHSVAGR